MPWDVTVGEQNKNNVTLGVFHITDEQWFAGMKKLESTLSFLSQLVPTHCTKAGASLRTGFHSVGVNISLIEIAAVQWMETATCERGFSPNPRQDWSAILVGRLFTCCSHADRHEWT
jgi:hypothetical protein